MNNSVLINSKTFIFICLLMLTGSCTFTGRYVFLNVPDVYDYKKLPSRTISNDPSPVFNFKTADVFNLNSIVPFGFNTTRVNNLDTFLEQSGTTAFLIIRNDTILYEKYFNGHTSTTLCKSFSASKVFVSALIGIAIDEGLIKSANDPVMKYIPELADKRLTGLTINHCLSLTSGIRSNNGQLLPWHDKVKIYYTPDIRKLLAGIEYDHEPGKEYFVEEYSPVLLALVIERATGRSLSKYLEEKLWKPLGMSNNALWVTDSKKNGFEAANSGLTAVPVDFAKFGRLYLNYGRFNNRQIISQKWITGSTMPDTTSVCFWRKIEYYDKKDVYFNDMWWGLRTDNKDYTYSASGHFGQRIFISPANNAIVVRFGTKEGKVDWTSFMMKISEKI
jgi:CubicO group peptidase (beta-lactamase class C family)